MRDITQTLVDKITTHVPHAGAQGSTMTTRYINMQDTNFFLATPNHNINIVKNLDSTTLMHPPEVII